MNEFQIAHALRGLQNQFEVPPLDPAKEEALLAAFDAHWARPRRRLGRGVWISATAASVAIAAALNWMVATSVRDRTRPAQGSAVPVVPVAQGFGLAQDDGADFVPWPGAATLPQFESGALMRVDLPVSALPALGFAPPSSGPSVVQADVIVGQDGLARAIRLVR